VVKAVLVAAVYDYRAKDHGEQDRGGQELLLARRRATADKIRQTLAELWPVCFLPLAHSCDGY
jgi:hypothetical protein